jgi:hypothetical protein
VAFNGDDEKAFGVAAVAAAVAAAAVVVVVVVAAVAAPARIVVVGDSLLFVSAPPIVFKARSVVSEDVGDKATGRVAPEGTVTGRVAETSADVFAETTIDDNEEEDEADEEFIAAVEAAEAEAAEAEAVAEAAAAAEREELAAATATAAVAAGDGVADDAAACATVENEAEADASGVSADDVGAAAVIDAAGPQKVCAMSTLAAAPDPTPSAACSDTAADLVERSVGARAGVDFGIGLSAFRNDMKASSGAAALGFPATPGAPAPGDRRLDDSGLSMDAGPAAVTEGADADVRSPPAAYAAGDAAAAPAASSPSSLRSLRET